MSRVLRTALVALFSAALLGSVSLAQSASPAKKPLFTSLEGYISYIQSNHKAPFDRDTVRLAKGAAAQIVKGLNSRTAAAATLSTGAIAGGPNVKVNKDRDPWPKAEIAVGVDPVNGNVVVMSNDYS